MIMINIPVTLNLKSAGSISRRQTQSPEIPKANLSTDQTHSKKFSLAY